MAETNKIGIKQKKKCAVTESDTSLMQSEMNESENSSDEELDPVKNQLLSVLENCWKSKPTKQKNDKSGSTESFHITSPLFAALKNSFQNLDYLSCARILHHLVKIGGCKMEHVFLLMTAILEKNPSQVSQLDRILEILSNYEGICTDEVRLIHIASYLNTGCYQEAAEVASKRDTKYWIKFTRNSAAVNAASDLLISYQTLLECAGSISKTQDIASHAMESFKVLANKNNFLSLFAECYVKLLIESSDLKTADEFIYKFVDVESRNGGLLAPLQAFAIVQRLMPKNQSLIFYLLQIIADSDPSHVLVLDLCWKYLRKNVPKKKGNHSDADSDLESGEEMDHCSRSKLYSLNRCLHLILNFLDCNWNDAQGWTILNENLRNICLIGASQSAKVLVDVWYKCERRSWWLNECFSSSPEDTPELVMDKAVCCFILEGQSHSFVAHALRTSKSSHLRSVISQLKNAKHRLDILVLSAVSCWTPAPLNSSTEELPVSQDEAKIRKLFLKFVQKSCAGTSQQAKLYNDLMSNHKPIRMADGSLCRRRDANFFWDLPFYDRFKKRLEKREARARKLLQEQKPPDELDSSCPTSENDTEDEIIDELLKHRPKTSTKKRKSRSKKKEQSEKSNQPTSAPPEVPSEYNVESPCPTPILHFQPPPSPKETIPIEDRYHFFLRDSSPSSSSRSSSSRSVSKSKINSENNPSQSSMKETNDTDPSSAQKSSKSLPVDNFRLEVSSPDIFQPDLPLEEAALSGLAKESETVDSNFDKLPIQQTCEKILDKYLTPDPVIRCTKKKEKRKGKINKKKSAHIGSLDQICRQVVDTAVKSQPISRRSASKHRSVSVLPKQKSNSDDDYREDLIAELLSNQQSSVSSSKKKLKKQKSKEKEPVIAIKTKKKKKREDIIAELLKRSKQTASVDHRPESIPATGKFETVTGSSKRKAASKAAETVEREEIIAELLKIKKETVADSCGKKKRVREYLPGDAEELMIQMAIQREAHLSLRELSDSVDEKSETHRKEESLKPCETRNIRLADILPNDPPSSEQLIEEWLKQVKKENAKSAKLGAESSKRPRDINDPSPEEVLFLNGPASIKRSKKPKFKPSRALSGVDSVAESIAPFQKKAVDCESRVSGPQPLVKRKKLFSKMGNFLDASYQSKKSKLL